MYGGFCFVGTVRLGEIAVPTRARPPGQGVRSRHVERVPQRSGSGQSLSPPTPRARGEVRELAMAPARRDCLPTLETSSASGAAGGQTMISIVQDRYGAAPEDVLRVAEIATPTVGEGEVLVRIRAASVDRGTWHLMSGLPYPIRLAGFGPAPAEALQSGPGPGRNDRSGR